LFLLKKTCFLKTLITIETNKNVDEFKNLKY